MCNVGLVDRVLRFLGGGGLIILALLPALEASLGGWRWLLLGWGLVMLATAAFRFCPAYRLFGFNSCA